MYRMQKWKMQEICMCFCVGSGGVIFCLIDGRVMDGCVCEFVFEFLLGLNLSIRSIFIVDVECDETTNPLTFVITIRNYFKKEKKNFCAYQLYIQIFISQIIIKTKNVSIMFLLNLK